MVNTIPIGFGLEGCSAFVSRKGAGAFTSSTLDDGDPGEAEGARTGSVTPGLPGQGWTIWLCRWVSGIRDCMVFEGA
jgi:hypothetical protein